MDRNTSSNSCAAAIAMLARGVQAVSREEALRFLTEFGDVEQRLARVRNELRLAEE